MACVVVDIRNMTGRGVLTDLIEKVHKNKADMDKLQQTLFQRAKLDPAISQKDASKLVRDLLALLEYMLTLTPKEAPFAIGHILILGSKVAMTSLGPIKQPIWDMVDQIDYLLTCMVYGNTESSIITILSSIL